MKNHVVAQPEMWKVRLTRPFPKRVEPASPLVLEYLTFENALRDRPAPQAAEIKGGFARVVKTTLSKFPEELKEVLKERLAGIVAVKDLGADAQTYPVRDASGKLVAAFIALDVDRVKVKPNDWASQRDAGIFQTGEYSVHVKLIADAKDRAPETMQYVLLHEIGHVLALFTRYVPNRDTTPAADWSRYAFLNLSWIAPQYRADKFGGFPTGVKLDFYKSPANLNAKIPEVYDWLERTNYPTLFSATDFHEDFAESFVHWVRLKRFNRPYSLSVYKGQTLVKTYLSCFAGTRCNDKAAVFEGLWKEPARTPPKDRPAKRPRPPPAAKKAKSAVKPIPPPRPASQ